MKLFGQIVRTAVNVVSLPITLPAAIVKDTLEVIAGESPEHTKELLEEIKDDAEED